MKRFILSHKLLTGLILLVALWLFLSWTFRDAPMYREVLGRSMEPTIHDGDSVPVLWGVEPKVNEVVMFDCKSDACEKSSRVTVLVKRVIKIDDKGCWWVEGDNKEHSIDSRNFGWVCPSDRFLMGAVKGL